MATFDSAGQKVVPQPVVASYTLPAMADLQVVVCPECHLAERVTAHACTLMHRHEGSLYILRPPALLQVASPTPPAPSLTEVLE